MKHTSQMPAEDLARAWCRHHGLVGTESGWIRFPDNEPVVQGYRTAAYLLQQQGVIEPGVGIHWRTADEKHIDPAWLKRAAHHLIYGSKP